MSQCRQSNRRGIIKINNYNWKNVLFCNTYIEHNIPFFQMLLEAMDTKLADHQHYTSRQLKPTDKELQHKIHFKIKHYAGDVVYNVRGFLDKNKDTLFQDFKRLLYKSNDSIISKMWPEGAQDITKVRKTYIYSYLMNIFLRYYMLLYANYYQLKYAF